MRAQVAAGLALGSLLGAAGLLLHPSAERWLADAHHGVVERARRFPVPVLRPPDRTSAAVGSGARIERLGAHAELLAEVKVPTDSPVVAIADRGDRVAIGTFDGGLFVYQRRGRALTEVPVDAWINGLAYGEDGILYVAAASGAYAVSEDGALTQLGASAAVAVAAARGGANFVGPAGLLAVRDGQLIRFGRAQGLGFGRLSSVASCGRAAVCVGSADGAWRVEGTGAEKWSMAGGQLPTDDVSAIAMGEHGELWIGTTDGGLARLGAEPRRFTVSDGLEEGRVLPGALVVLGTTAFAGTPTGLLVLRGARAGKVLEGREITAVARDQEGLIWIGFKGGIARVALSEGDRT